MCVNVVGITVIRVIAGAAFLTAFTCVIWLGFDPVLYAEALYVLLIICILIALMLMRKIRYDILSSLAQSQHVPAHAMYIPMANSAAIEEGGTVPLTSSVPGVVAITFPVTQQA